MPRRAAIQISVDRLHELFELREDGHLLYRCGRGKVRAGAVAGYARADGYWVVCVDWKKVLAHRVVFAMHNGYWPALDVDHIDGCPANNSPGNLREASHEENQRNRKNGNKNNTSGLSGVVWDKARGLWMVQIHTRRKNHHFGRWADLELAGAIAAAARERLHSSRPLYY